jgi:predicted transcriptional regulator
VSRQLPSQVETALGFVVYKNVDWNRYCCYNRQMSSTTVRVSREIHELLKNLAEQSASSMQDVLVNALEIYRRQLFLDGLNEDFEAAQGYHQEIEDVDGTAGDGLEDY